MSDRTTFIIGAGAPLDLKLPKGVLKPSTYNITQEVIKPYENPSDKTKFIHIVNDVYYRLMDTYPHSESSKPDVTFEHIFHVLEMLRSYGTVWKNKCKDPKMFPPFASFTDVIKGLTIDYSLISKVVFDKFITQILDIVGGYDKEFRTNIEKHKWYKDFFVHFGCENMGDFFNLNYDTTIEESIRGKYEDGYEEEPKQPFQRFNPRKFSEKATNLSTVNHLHGCINYDFPTYKNVNKDVYKYRTDDRFKNSYFSVAEDPFYKSRQIRTDVSALNEAIYYLSPIITGLHKLEKLNCIPFDFYHANLINCIINSPRLVIIGYGFGDSYCNQIIERMNLLHRKEKRIVLIDLWDKDYYDKIISARDDGKELSDNKWQFLRRVMDYNDTKEVIDDLFPIGPDECDCYEKCRKFYEDKKILQSKDKSVMILPHGFKKATKAIKKIDKFLGGED